LHSLFDAVRTERHLELALDALTLCRTRVVAFNDRTPAKLVAACDRVGRPEAAYEVLSEHVRYRLWPGRRTYQRLMLSAAVGARDADLFAKCAALLPRAGGGARGTAGGTDLPERNGSAYHDIVHCCRVLGDVAGIAAAVREAKADGVALRRSTYVEMCKAVAAVDVAGAEPALAEADLATLRAAAAAAGAFDHPVNASVAADAIRALDDLEAASSAETVEPDGGGGDNDNDGAEGEDEAAADGK